MAKSKSTANKAKTNSKAETARRTVRSRKVASGFKNIQTEGAVLPFDILTKIAAGSAEIQGLKPEDYSLTPGERLSERVTEVWFRTRRCWTLFRNKRAELPTDDYGTTLTRKSWLIPLFDALGYRLEVYRTQPTIDGKSYDVTHYDPQTPVALHLASFRQDLDSRNVESKAGARVSPHSTIQEYVNVSDAHLWGVATNGRRFRIMRDNASLVRAAYVEFDLESIMESESYGEFYLFFLLAHRSRFERRSDETFVDAAKEEGKEEENAPETFVDVDCWMEKWRKIAMSQGVRALDTLRDGVQDAIVKLGKGFLENKNNEELKRRLRKGELSSQEFYRQLLRLVYRILVLFIAEDRELLFAKDATPEAKEIYVKYYSVSRIRDLSRRNRGGRSGDVWERLRLLFRWFSQGEARLGIPAFGSTLFSEAFVRDLESFSLANDRLLPAIRRLTHTTINDCLQPIDYRNVDSEELGSVYESLLELRPIVDGKEFTLEIVGGNERKTTGSYYTPQELVDSLLDTALEPTLKEALSQARTLAEREEALLNLKICDPACGSGHFLVGAARRLGKRLAQIRSGEEEPAPGTVLKGVRDVVSRCLYGVDLNPTAVELCKISLWVESMNPGKALMFLDHRIRVGDALIGATPELLESGIPDEAFTELEGDDKERCKSLKAKNRGERDQKARFFDFDPDVSRSVVVKLERSARAIDEISNDTAVDYEAREEAFRRYLDSPTYRTEKLKADLWCAAFFWRKTDDWDSDASGEKFGITQGLLNRAKNEGELRLSPIVNDELARIVEEYRFFHWHIEFADVFARGERSGFDVVLGNPPWERLKLQEKEWFAQRDPEIAKAKNAAARKKLIEALKDEYPETYVAFTNAKRAAESRSLFVRCSGRFPYCGRGDVNTYSVFAELDKRLVAATGRVGCVVPSGLVSDDTTKAFFQYLMKTRAVASLYDFENRNKIFSAVDSRMKFTLLTLTGGGLPVAATEASFFNFSAADVRDPERAFALTREDIEAINPNTLTCPIFRGVKDMTLTQAVYRRAPVLVREKQGEREEENPWNVKMATMFHMSNDSKLFRGRETLEAAGFRLDGNVFTNDAGVRYLPLYEGKMVTFYNHRAADVVRSATAVARQAQPQTISAEERRDPNRLAFPLYWIAEEKARDAIRQKTSFPWKLNGIISFSKVTSPTNRRTFAPTMFPLAGAGDSLQLILANVSAAEYACLYACCGAFIFDYASRQKIGGTNMNFYLVRQLPAPRPEVYRRRFDSTSTFADFILPRVLELTYTATDMRAFAKDCGYDGEPFLWDEERRFRLRCELDALCFGLYFGFGDWSEATEREESPEERAQLKSVFPTPLDALDYVMKTFPIVERLENADELKTRVAADACERLNSVGDLTDADGDRRYPSHAAIRAIYRAMTKAVRENGEYRTVLTPPPANGFGAKTSVKIDAESLGALRAAKRGLYWTKLVLKTWNRKITRDLFNATLVFALNPHLRKTRSFTDSAAPEIPDYIENLDGALRLAARGWVEITTEANVQYLRLVKDDETEVYDPAHVEAVKEAIECATRHENDFNDWWKRTNGLKKKEDSFVDAK